MSQETPATDAGERTHICVVGAGTMGRGITQVAVAHGHPVSLVDPSPAQLEAAVAEIRQRLAKRQPEIADNLAAHLAIATSLSETEPHHGTVVIEAVVEDLDVK